MSHKGTGDWCIALVECEEWTVYVVLCFGAVLYVLSGGQCGLNDHIQEGFQCLSFVQPATQGARCFVLWVLCREAYNASCHLEMSNETWKP